MQVVVMFTILIEVTVLQVCMCVYIYIYTHTHVKTYCTLNCATYCYHCCLVTKSCLTFRDPMDCSPPGSSLSMGIPREEYWSGLPFHSPGNLTNTGIEPIHDSWVSCTGRQILYHWANYSLFKLFQKHALKIIYNCLVKHSNPTLFSSIYKSTSIMEYYYSMPRFHSPGQSIGIIPFYFMCLVSHLA